MAFGDLVALGIWKSQLALTYLQRYGNQYDATFWIRSISPVSLDGSFRDIYCLLPGLDSLPPTATTEAVRFEVLLWFGQNHGKWLFVFDEADGLDPKDKNFTPIREYFPGKCNAHILITSRSTMAGDLSTFEGIEVRGLELAESVNLFLACAKLREPTEEIKTQAELIARELGQLPLALRMAGSYVSQTPRLAADLSQYLEEHREHLNLLQQEPQQLTDIYKHSLMASWETSYQAVERELPDACRVFDLLRFLGKEHIYLDLLTPDSDGMWPGHRHNSFH